MPREQYIEASRAQAISFDQDNNAVWTNNVKDLEINVGDEISVLSSMVSTNGGGGDEYIQITDREVDGVKENEVTLEFEFYKSADAKGIISLPYHAVNFAAPNATTVSDIFQSSNRYGYCVQEQFDPNKDDISVHGFSSVSTPANSGIKLTAVFRDPNGRFKVVKAQKTVRLEPGYYTPSQIGETFTALLNEPEDLDVDPLPMPGTDTVGVSNVPSTWGTTSYKAFQAQTYYPLPNLIPDQTFLGGGMFNAGSGVNYAGYPFYNLDPSQSSSDLPFPDVNGGDGSPQELGVDYNYARNMWICLAHRYDISGSTNGYRQGGNGLPFSPVLQPTNISRNAYPSDPWDVGGLYYGYMAKTNLINANTSADVSMNADPNVSILDYGTKQNACFTANTMGVSCFNFGRWSKMQMEPLAKQDDSDPLKTVKPECYMVRYPHYFQAGSALSQQNPENATHWIYYQDFYSLDYVNPYKLSSESVVYPYLSQNVQGDWTALYPPLYFQTSPSGNMPTNDDSFRTLLYDFVSAQIEDGMITTEALPYTAVNPYTGAASEVFFAYFHQMANLNNQGANSDGSIDADSLDDADIMAIDCAGTWDFRARGLVVLVFRDDFINQTNGCGFIQDSSDQYGFYYVSYISQQGLKDPLSNTDIDLEDSIGWADCPAMQTNYPPVSNSTVVPAADLKYFSIGWSQSCLAPFNFMNLLVSYTPDRINFSSSINEGSDFNAPSGDGSRMGWRFQDTVFLGATAPSLNYNADNGRFSFCGLHSTQQQYNEYDAGESCPAILLNNTVSQPLIDVQSNMTYGIPCVGGDGSDTNLGTDKNIPTNPNAGTPCVFINFDEWRMVNRALYQLAPNWSKISRFYVPGQTFPDGTTNVTDPDTYIWRQRSPLFMVSSGLGTTQATFSDSDALIRSYCICEDVRQNTWCSVFGGMFQQDASQKEYLYQPVINSMEAGEFGSGDIPNGFWTSLQGDSGFTERTNAEGNIRPNPSIIYDTVSGVWITKFGTNITSEASFKNSLFYKLGYTYQDLFPTMIQNGREYRNIVLDSTLGDYTGRDMEPVGCSPTENNANDALCMGTFGRSIPYTTDEILGGYVSITTNRLGESSPQISIPDLWITNPNGSTNGSRGGTNVVTGFQPNFDAANVTPGGLDGGPLKAIFNAGGGDTIFNNQVKRNRLAMGQVLEDNIYGTRLYATNFPQKTSISFYTIRSSLVQGDPLYVNNADTYAQLPVIGLVIPSYASGDVFYTMETGMVYTATSNYKASELTTGIFDSEGKPADVSPACSVIYKIARASPLDPRAPPAESEEEAAAEADKAERRLAKYRAELATLI